ncbi:MAG TPA: type II secretion system protein N, partial [Casimicrobiaceae bacterium]|nr:type II secretion system protein N [Casimicrobiaceae bacterium]
MRRALVVVAAIVVVLAAIAAFAPAALVGVAVERLSRGAVSIAESDGTVWHGRGTLDVQGAARVPLEWRLDPFALARGEARMAIAPPSPALASPRADFSARQDAVTVRALDVALPAQAIAALAPRAAVRLEGELRVTSPSLEWARGSIGGAARVRWSDARFAI